MKKSEIFLEAANAIAAKAHPDIANYCCHEIMLVELGYIDSKNTKTCNYFLRWLNSPTSGTVKFNYEAYNNIGVDKGIPTEIQEHRILALCMAAAIAESEGD